MVLGGFSVSVAISGPIGSYAVLNIAQRFAFWLPLIAVAAVCFFAFRIWALRRFPSHYKVWPTVLVAVIFAVVSAPVIGAMFRTFVGPDFGTLAGMGEIAALVFLLTSGLTFLQHPANPGQLGSDPVALTEALPQIAEAPRLLERLPPAKRGAIVRLEVQDHYVQVTTDKGRSNLLMRLSDAIAETLPVEGAQVHRSYWVAWDAVQQAEQDKGRWYLSMQDGARVPVSRANVTKLETRGLI